MILVLDLVILMVLLLFLQLIVTKVIGFMWSLLICSRNASECNAQHDVEVNSARVAAEEDVAKNSEDVLRQFDGQYDFNVLTIGPLALY